MCETSQTVRKYLQINARIGKEARKICLPRPSEKGSIVKISHLEQISRLEDQNKQADLLGRVITEDWTVGKLRREVDQELGIEKPKPVAKPEAYQTITCQTCRASLLLVHDANGSHRLLLKGRRA